MTFHRSIASIRLTALALGLVLAVGLAGCAKSGRQGQQPELTGSGPLCDVLTTIRRVDHNTYDVKMRIMRGDRDHGTATLAAEPRIRCKAEEKAFVSIDGPGCGITVELRLDESDRDDKDVDIDYVVVFTRGQHQQTQVVTGFDKEVLLNTEVNLYRDNYEEPKPAVIVND